MQMWLCEDKLNRKKAHFCLLPAAQKRRLLKLPIISVERSWLWVPKQGHFAV